MQIRVESSAARVDKYGVYFNVVTVGKASAGPDAEQMYGQRPQTDYPAQPANSSSIEWECLNVKD